MTELKTAMTKADAFMDQRKAQGVNWIERCDPAALDDFVKLITSGTPEQVRQLEDKYFGVVLNLACIGMHELTKGFAYKNYSQELDNG